MYEVKPPSLRVWPTAYITRQTVHWFYEGRGKRRITGTVVAGALTRAWVILFYQWNTSIDLEMEIESSENLRELGRSGYDGLQHSNSEMILRERARAREKGTLVLTNCDNGNGKSVQEGHYDSHLRGLALSKSTQDDIFSRHDVSEA